MPYLENHDEKIYYQTEGDTGPWVTLINGHMREHSDFRMLARKLVAAGYRCISLDNRGVGKSPVESSFDIEDLSSDIAAIWKELAVTETHLLGISMGGVIAQTLVNEYTEQIQSLILISSFNDSKFVNPDTSGDWPSSQDEILSRLKQYVTEDFFERNKLLVVAMAKQMKKNFEDPVYQKGAKFQRAAIRSIQTSPSDDAKEIPLLVIHGKDDRVIEAKAAQEIAKQFTDSKIEMYEDAGHLLLAESAKNLYESIIGFLDLNQ